MQYGIEDKHLDKPSESENPIEVYTVKKYFRHTDSQTDISENYESVCDDLIAYDLGLQSKFSEHQDLIRNTTLNSCTCLFTDCEAPIVY